MAKKKNEDALQSEADAAYEAITITLVALEETWGKRAVITAVERCIATIEQYKSALEDVL